MKLAIVRSHGGLHTGRIGNSSTIAKQNIFEGMPQEFPERYRHCYSDAEQMCCTARHVEWSQRNVHDLSIKRYLTGAIETGAAVEEET